MTVEGAECGLELKLEKTRVCHTLKPIEYNGRTEEPGFDFLGFNANSVFVDITIKGKCVSTRRPFLFVLGNKPNLLYFRVGLSDSCTHISLSMNGTESIDRVFVPCT